MCSGCSGYFDGEEDREDGVNAGSEGLAWRWADSNSENRRVVTDVDDYEVLVSDQRIVERRSIRANSSVFSASEALGNGGQMDHGGSRIEQTASGSARTYRTQGCCGGGGASQPPVRHKFWIWLLLLVVAVGALNLLGAMR